jgi:predicted nucleotidyltransferase
MVIYKVLDNLFSTWSNISVMRALKNYSVGISGSEVSRLAGLTPKNCLITLTALEELGVVIRIRGGREHLFSLNRSHFLVQKVIIPVLNSEIKFVESILKDIRNALKKFTVSIILFGSVALHRETIESDLDVCLIYKNGSLKKQIEDVISILNSSLNKKYGVSLAPYYISELDFIQRAKKSKPPVVDIIKEGKLLSGKNIKEILNG